MPIRKFKIDDCVHDNLVKEVMYGQRTGDYECFDCGLSIEKESVGNLKKGRQW